MPGACMQWEKRTDPESGATSWVDALTGSVTFSDPNVSDAGGLLKWSDATVYQGQGEGGTTSVFVPKLASIAGFGVLWVLKYIFLDKIMFGPHHHTPYDEDIEREEATGLVPEA